MILNIGVTGTREGMTVIQESNLKDIIEKLLFEQEYTERIFHHGQCVGVDVQTAKIFKQYGFKIISHPPTKTELIGICNNDIIQPAKGYLARDRDIVDVCDILLALPKENSPQSKGGTWYTYNYSIKQKKVSFLFYPNGEIIYKGNI